MQKPAIDCDMLKRLLRYATQNKTIFGQVSIINQIDANEPYISYRFRRKIAGVLTNDSKGLYFSQFKELIKKSILSLEYEIVERAHSANVYDLTTNKMIHINPEIDSGAQYSIHRIIDSAIYVLNLKKLSKELEWLKVRCFKS